MRRGRNRVLRWAAFAALALVAIQACSSSDSTSSVEAAVPPTIAIGLPLDSLGCDDSLVVHLTTSWAKLRPPGYCGTLPNCGSVEVTLLETEDGPPLLSQRAATADVQLDLTQLVSPGTTGGPALSQVHFIRAQLFTDTLQPVVVTGDAGNGSQAEAISLSPPAGCSAQGGAGSGGAAGAAGADAGAAGAAGALGAAGGQGGETNTGGSAAAAEAGAAGMRTAAGAAPI